MDSVWKPAFFPTKLICIQKEMAIHTKLDFKEDGSLWVIYLKTKF